MAEGFNNETDYQYNQEFDDYNNDDPPQSETGQQHYGNSQYHQDAPGQNVYNNVMRSSTTSAPKMFFAKYDYNPLQRDELSFSAGETLTYISDSKEDGFLFAANCQGQRGLVPMNYIEEKKKRVIPKIPPPDTQAAFKSKNEDEENHQENVTAPKHKKGKKVSNQKSDDKSEAKAEKANKKTRSPTEFDKFCSQNKIDNNTRAILLKEGLEDLELLVDFSADELKGLGINTGQSRYLERGLKSYKQHDSEDTQKSKSRMENKKAKSKLRSKRQEMVSCVEEESPEEEADDDEQENDEEETQTLQSDDEEYDSEEQEVDEGMSEEDIFEDAEEMPRASKKRETNVKMNQKSQSGKTTGGQSQFYPSRQKGKMAQSKSNEQPSRQTRNMSQSKSSSNTSKQNEGSAKEYRYQKDIAAKSTTIRKSGNNNSESTKTARNKTSDSAEGRRERGQGKQKLPQSKGKGHFHDLIKETGNTSETAKKKGVVKRFFGYMKRLVVEDDNEYATYTSKVNGIDVYKFPLRETHRDERNRIRKVTIGTELQASLEKTILLVGATGSGKSTMTDGMINFIYSMTWEDNYRLTLVDLQEDEKNKVKKTESQTEWITAYTVPKSQFSCLPYALTIVDMPGFGDTRGVQRDEQLVKQLKKLFSSGGETGIDAVSAVCFIAKAGDARLTATQRYIFNQILELFGKNIEENIQILISFADGKPPVVMEALQEAGVPFNKSFKFNNSALFSSARSDDQKAGEDPFTKIFWEMGMRSYADFFDYLGSVLEQSLTLSGEVLKEREQLNTIISNLRENIQKAMVKIDDHNRLEEDLRKNKRLMETNAEYEIVRMKDKLEKVKMKEGKYVTYCEQCEYTCHQPCPNDDVEECAAMDPEGKCEVCPGRCLATDHITRDFYFERTVIKIQTTLDDVKATFLKAKKGTENLEGLVEPIRKERKVLEDQVKEMVAEVTECLERLDKIALKKGKTSATDYYKLLIEEEKQNGQVGYEGRVAKLEKLIEEDEISKRIQKNDTKLLLGSQQTAV